MRNYLRILAPATLIAIVVAAGLLHDSSLLTLRECFFLSV